MQYPRLSCLIGDLEIIEVLDFPRYATLLKKLLEFAPGRNHVGFAHEAGPGFQLGDEAFHVDLYRRLTDVVADQGVVWVPGISVGFDLIQFVHDLRWWFSGENLFRKFLYNSFATHANFLMFKAHAVFIMMQLRSGNSSFPDL